MTVKKWAALIAALVVFAGCAVLVFRPAVQSARTEAKLHGTVETFRQQAAQRQAERQQEAQPSGQAKPQTEPAAPAYMSDPLWLAMRRYNDKLVANEQSKLSGDHWYQDEALDFESLGVADGVIGVITIPSIGVELPLYSGASADHLGQGLAVMCNTSLPIGGESAHCVIAGHRGWSNGDFLLDIEEIKAGDAVLCTNLWQTLTYTVEDIQVIEPDVVTPAKIQPGRDLLTLLTCHPYGSGGQYRYLVICTRDEAEKVVESTENPVVSTTVTAPEEPTAPTEPVIRTEAASFRPEQKTSSGAIKLKKLAPVLGALLVAALAAFLIVQALRRRRH